MWVLGLSLVCGLYFLVGLHFETYIRIISPLLKKRFGTELGLIWTVVGLVIVYNIVYNHFFAMILKPGSPSDLRKVESMRQTQKNRAHRKSVEASLDNDSKYDGISPDVKKLLRYRQKTMQ